MTHEQAMREALRQAQIAALEGDVPVGALVMHGDDVVAMAHNEREKRCDPTAHAEVLALQAAAKALGRRRLNGCRLYVTLESCPMCAGALVMACVDRCYFGARDERQGCCESIYALTQDPAFYHRLPCVGGLLDEECSGLMKMFFQNRRQTDPKEKGVLS